LKAWWERYSSHIDALSLRERVLVFAALAVALISLTNWLLFDPLQSRRIGAQEQIAAQEGGLTSIHEQIVTLTRNAGRDPDKTRRGKLASLRAQAGEMDTEMRDIQSRLVPPERMTDLLKTWLNRGSRLELLAMRTLPTEPIMLKPEDSGKAGQQLKAPALYRHAVELKLRGGYADMNDYLRKLENNGGRLYWDAMKLDAEYPATTLTLTLHTLSLDDSWLSL
jgi:MSHA biogenesis protein MshJ